MTPSYFPAHRYGGPIRTVHGLCSALVRRGHEVEVFTTSIDGDKDSAVSIRKPVNLDGVKVTYHRGSFPRRLFAAEGLAASCHNRVKEFDLVHIHSMFLMPTRHAAAACRRSRVPYVLAPRGMLDQTLVRARSYWAKNIWIALIDKRNIKAAAAIHFTSEAERLAFRKMGFRCSNELLLSNGVDMDRTVNSPESKSTAKGFGLFLGRLSWKKGLDVLLDAWARVPDIQLVIAGTDDEKITPELRRQAEKLGIAQRVIFAGPVHGQDKTDLLQQAQVFVLPSRGENFAVAVLEAMAAGCPVVISQGVGLADVVAAERCGRVVDGNADSVMQAVAWLINNPDEGRAMGQRGLEVVSRQYTWDVIAEQAELAYRSLLADSPTGTAA